MPAIKHSFLCRRARRSCLCFNLHDDKSLRESCLTQNKRKFPLVRDDSVLARLPTSRQATMYRATTFLCRKIFTESCLTCIMLAQEKSIFNGCRWREKSWFGKANFSWPTFHYNSGIVAEFSIITVTRWKADVADDEGRRAPKWKPLLIAWIHVWLNFSANNRRRSETNMEALSRSWLIRNSRRTCRRRSVFRPLASSEKHPESF